ncbi:hypothetical protein Tco_1453928, partial [Tanacetum coccineum]
RELCPQSSISAVSWRSAREKDQRILKGKLSIFTNEERPTVNATKESIDHEKDGHSITKKINEGAKQDRFLALGWILEEIHVTWAHLEKKRTRLRTYTKSHDDFCTQWPEMASQA